MQGNFSKSFRRFLHEHILNRWYLILPAIFLFVYIVIRAKLLSITWDEANTFFEYVRTPHWFTQEYNYMSANNHLLNTWLMKISIALFGESEFALRLPNVIAGGIYLLASMKIAEKLFERKWQILFAFFLLTLNPFILDFFSTARGYGISLALMMCALVQLQHYVRGENGIKRVIFAQLFLVGAILANLTMIYLLIAITILLVFNRFVFHRNNRPALFSFFITLIPVIAIAIFLPYVHLLKMSGAFFYGEESKSPADTFLSLSQCSLYNAFYSAKLVPVVTILFSAVSLFSVLLVARNLPSLKSEQGKWMAFITMLLLLCIAGPIAQHILMKSNFLSGRTAIFYLPLLSMNFLSLLFYFPKPLKDVSVIVVGIFSVLHFSLVANTHFFYDWREQSDVKNAMMLLKSKNIPIAENCFANIICTDLPFEKEINYYRMRLGMDNFSHAARKENVPLCSYYYLSAAGMDELKGRTEVVGEFPASGTFLFYVPHRSYDPPKLKFVTEVWQDFEHEDAFLELRTDSVFIGNKGTFAGGIRPFSIGIPLVIPDSVKTENLVATLNCRLYYYTHNTSALLVFSFDDGNNKSWEGMHISELSVKPKEWSITGWTRPVPPGTKKIRVYLWNTDKTEVLMDNVALRLLSYPRENPRE